MKKVNNQFGANSGFFYPLKLVFLVKMMGEKKEYFFMMINERRDSIGMTSMRPIVK